MEAILAKLQHYSGRNNPAHVISGAPTMAKFKTVKDAEDINLEQYVSNK